MAKKKKEEKGKKVKKKAGKETPETNGAVATKIVQTADGQISERASEPAPGPTLESDERGWILDAWIGSGVRLRHPINMSSAFAVGSTTGQLEATDDRGVLLRLKRDQLQFYPWSCVYAIMPDDKGKVDEE